MKAFLICVTFGIMIAEYAGAMALPQHVQGTGELGGMDDLRGTLPRQGGIGDMARRRIESISRWMDNPATRIGETRNRMAGGESLSPWNHRAQRHNPERVAKAFAGRGQPDPAVRNVARVHKLQDIATGRAPTDGHVITPNMRRNARNILKRIRTYRRLPPDNLLPTWVDQSGPGILRTRQAGPSTPAASAPCTTMRSASGRPTVGAAVRPSSKFATAARITGRAAGPVLVTGSMAYEAYRVEQAYSAGQLTGAQRTAHHGVSVTATACGWAGAVAGGKGGAAIGTLICPGIGTAVGGAVGSLVGGISAGMGSHFAGRASIRRWIK